MEKTNLSHGFPWLLAVFLCLYIGLTAFAVTGMKPKTGPQTVPTEPTATAPAEPDCEGVFTRLFADPDWEALYDRAGEQAGEFEAAASFAAHMNALVREKTLTYQQVQAASADTHRYLVYADDMKIAAFTMTGGLDWALDALELYYEPAISVLVEALPEHTVYVNGVALDDSYTIRSVETVAEGYLPENVHGYRRKWQRVEGLLANPEIVVLDETGTPVPMEQDAETGIFRPLLEAPVEMTQAEADLARQAAIADAKYAIGALSNAQLKTYFDENSDLYQMLVTNPRNLQRYTSSSIDENTIQVGQFCRYSDTLFSVNVKLTQKIIRTNGTLKIYRLDKTYFFTLTENGYRVTAYTTQDVTQRMEQLRLCFVAGEDQICTVVPGDACRVSVPEDTVPEGEEFLGWATQTKAADGSVTMTVRILPDGTLLGTPEPMTLYPIYQ